jgi:hypothetical protein
MKKITIKLDDILFEKMNERLTKNGHKTISQCARELIDLGLRVEEAASLQSEKKDGEGTPSLLFSMLKSNMAWSMEARLLSRFLVENIVEEGGLDYMAKAKEAAAKHIEKIVQEWQKNPV